MQTCQRQLTGQDLFICHCQSLQAKMGSQKHTTHLIHPEDDASLSWDSECTFVAPVPVKDRIVRLEVRSTSTRTKQGKVLAHAHIPLFQLIGFNTGLSFVQADAARRSQKCM